MAILVPGRGAAMSLAAAALILGGCAGGDAAPQPSATDSPAAAANQQTAPAPAGNPRIAYVLSDWAGRQENWGDAARFAEAALADAGDVPAVRAQAVRSFVMTGDLAAAAEVTGDLGDGNWQETAWRAVARYSLAMADDDPAAAEDALGQLGDSGLAGLIKPGLNAWARAAAGTPGAAAEALMAEASGTGVGSLAAYHAGLMAWEGGDPRLALTAFHHARALAQGQGERPSAALAAMADPAADSPVPEAATAGAARYLDALAASFRREPHGRWSLVLAHSAAELDATPARQNAVAESLAHLGRHDEAAAAYARVLAGQPGNIAAAVGRARSLAELERVDAALAALENLPQATRDAHARLIAAERAFLHQGRDDHGAAAAAFGEALAAPAPAESPDGLRVPAPWRLHFGRGIALHQAGDWPEAEAAMERALSLGGDSSPELLNYLGYSWIDRGERLSEAKAMVAQAVEREPDNAYYIDSLGWAHYRMGDIAAAIEQLERAAELRPGDPEITEHLGDAYWRAGREREARYQWERALRDGVDAETAERLRDKIADGIDGDAR